MGINLAEIKVSGKRGRVLSVQIDDSKVVVTGNVIRIAIVNDEEWLEDQVVHNPELYLGKIKTGGLNADIFTFAEKLPQVQPRFSYHMEWDNVAAIPITMYQDWWEKRLPKVTRKNIRRAYKRGVTARVTEFNDELVRGIVEIHNDTPIRQGRPFLHYGKEFSFVKEDYYTYRERSEFIGAYHGDELIGIVKLIYMKNFASIMQILSKSRHYDKRPTNVLIAKAVELCEEKGLSFLVYGKYVYGNKTDNSLTEFKRRNGFSQINIPRYYIPVTLKGRMALKLNLHLGLLGILPGSVITFLRDTRSRYVRLRLQLSGLGGKTPDVNQIKAPGRDGMED